ncbi:phage tail protein [Winogradskyella psychrotolerans]|uniref:phage tail protein n=1 Tax=Winogradskyella psychrotolerans TaxID=1344585 RepID=UPI001C06EE51|nr:tail fiber protein [Winogradskyella psychrotolerans]MBU2926978.1 phage tail protein [Winogradskyella psychrotolerans]
MAILILPSYYNSIKYYLAELNETIISGLQQETLRLTRYGFNVNCKINSMKYLFYTLAILVSFTISLQAQVGIGTTTPDASSILDVESDDKGLLIPRMTALDRLAIISPAEGLMVYQTNDVKGFYFYDGLSWDRLLNETKDAIPIGAIFTFPMAATPVGYLVCDGSAVSRTTYADLFTVLGVTYGEGNGSTTFNLPDYRGKFLRGHDAAAGNDPNALTRNNRGDGTTGDAVGTQQDNAFTDHTHSIDPPNTESTTNGNHNHTATASSSTSTTTGSHMHQLKGELGKFQLSTSTFAPQYFLIRPGSGPDNYNTPSTGSHNHSTTPTIHVASNGDHIHNVNIDAFSSGGSYTGSTESRPINISVIWCIKY